MTNPNQRFSVGLVPPPTPPAATAAPAAAGEAGADAGLTEADLWWIGVYDGALAERDAERCRATAAEAERDALRGALAGLAAAADDGEWHDSEDCEVEGRTDCRLCAALATATATAPQAAGTGTGGADHAAP